jgi:sigma-E factor negative regulatory protein RseA
MMVTKMVEKMNSDNNLAKNVLQNASLSEFQKAQIIDLADGLLHGDAFADAMTLLDANSQATAYWHCLHVIGDSLRGDATAGPVNIAKDMAFLDTFRANLAKESPLKVIAQVNDVRVAVPTANDSFFNWKWVGGLSAAAAAVVLSWNFVGTTSTAPNGSGAQLAHSAVQAVPLSSQTAAGVMLRNPQLDALIAAHNQVGGSSALQMPSGFLRSATFNTGMPATVVSDK